LFEKDQYDSSRLWTPMTRPIGRLRLKKMKLFKSAMIDSDKEYMYSMFCTSLTAGNERK